MKISTVELIFGITLFIISGILIYSNPIEGSISEVFNDSNLHLAITGGLLIFFSLFKKTEEKPNTYYLSTN